VPPGSVRKAVAPLVAQLSVDKSVHSLLYLPLLLGWGEVGSFLRSAAQEAAQLSVIYRTS
jgi:hypothetical protein